MDKGLIAKENVIATFGTIAAVNRGTIERIEEIAFPELGCESIKRLTVKNMPLTVGVDICGNSIFNR